MVLAMAYTTFSLSTERDRQTDRKARKGARVRKRVRESETDR